MAIHFATSAAQALLKEFDAQRRPLGILYSKAKRDVQAARTSCLS